MEFFNRHKKLFSFFFIALSFGFLGLTYSAVKQQQSYNSRAALPKYAPTYAIPHSTIAPIHLPSAAPTVVYQVPHITYSYSGPTPTTTPPSLPPGIPIWAVPAYPGNPNYDPATGQTIGPGDARFQWQDSHGAWHTGSPIVGLNPQLQSEWDAVTPPDYFGNQTGFSAGRLVDGRYTERIEGKDGPVYRVWDGSKWIDGGKAPTLNDIVSGTGGTIANIQNQSQSSTFSSTSNVRQSGVSNGVSCAGVGALRACQAGETRACYTPGSPGLERYGTDCLPGQMVLCGVCYWGNVPIPPGGFNRNDEFLNNPACRNIRRCGVGETRGCYIPGSPGYQQYGTDCLPGQMVYCGVCFYPNVPLPSSGAYTNNSTSTPTETTCASKPQGDANCDNKIDLVDFALWRQDFISDSSTSSTDFNDSGKTDVVDFGIWRTNFL